MRRSTLLVMTSNAQRIAGLWFGTWLFDEEYPCLGCICVHPRKSRRFSSIGCGICVVGTGGCGIPLPCAGVQSYEQGPGGDWNSTTSCCMTCPDSPDGFRMQRELADGVATDNKCYRIDYCCDGQIPCLCRCKVISTQACYAQHQDDFSTAVTSSVVGEANAL